MREMVIEWALREKLVAIVRGVESEKCLKVAQALYDGGIRLMEVTYDQKNPDSWKQTAQAIGDIAKAFEGRMLVGAGTVTSTQLVEMTPGPMLFETNKVLVCTIFLGMFIANTLMCICGFAGIRLFSLVLKVPKQILTPAIFDLCIIGSFAMKNSLFDVWVMLIAGVVGYFLSKLKVPTSPAILGLILGPMAEKNFRTALLKSGGDPSVFFSTVICWFFIILIIGTLFGGQAKKLLFKKKAAK